MYDEIKLSTFTNDAHIFQKQILLAGYCLDLKLYDEAFIKIDRVSGMSLSTAELEAIEADLGDEYIEKLVKKGQKGNDKLSESLKELWKKFRHEE